MIKDETKKLIDKAIEIELQNALEQKEFADAHHAYAILKEEFEEVERIFDSGSEFDNYIADDFCHALRDFWFAVKDNDDKRIKYDLDKVLKCAKEAMAELAQVAAVCEKAQQQLFGKEE